MRPLAFLAAYPGIACGVLGGTLGLALAGAETGVLWLVVGFFLGKSVQSTVWTLTDRRPS